MCQVESCTLLLTYLLDSHCVMCCFIAAFLLCLFAHHHHHHLQIYSAPITFAAIGAVQKSYEQQQTLMNVKSKGKIMGF